MAIQKLKAVLTKMSLVLLLIALCSFQPIQHSQTRDDKEKLKKELLRKFNEMGLPFSDVQKEIWANCVIEKGERLAKSKGAALTSNEATQLFARCGDEIVNTQVLNGWNPKFEKNLYDGLVIKYLKESNDTARVKLIASCVLKKIKAEYPKGLNKKDLNKKPLSFYKSCFN